MAFLILAFGLSLCIGGARLSAHAAIRSVALAIVAGACAVVLAMPLSSEKAGVLMAALFFVAGGPAIEELGRYWGLRTLGTSSLTTRSALLAFGLVWAGAEVVWKAANRFVRDPLRDWTVTHHNLSWPSSIDAWVSVLNVVPAVGLHVLATYIVAHRMQRGAGLIRSWLSGYGVHVGYNVVSIVLFSVIGRSGWPALFWILALTAALVLLASRVSQKVNSPAAGA